MAQRPLDDQQPLPVDYPSELPISERREDLLEAISDNQILVVAGETGSGKSTQLPKMCLELGLGAGGKRIGHTQPRRLAARTIADRVAAELPNHPPKTVGYKVRFDDQVSQDTQIKLMTDGVLLSETQRDRSLRQYSVIIVDEAHERSLNIDFLLGYLKQLCQRRSDLKVIITSATIDTERFSKHFDDAPVIEVSGRMYPVEVRYQPLDIQTPNQAPSAATNSRPSGPTAKHRRPAQRQPRRQPGRQGQPRRQTSTVQAEAISEAVQDLWIETDGDILVFCSGEQEIRDAIDAISELTLPNTDLLPLYARLSSAEQQRVFKRHKNRRVVVSTNVAETSVTVPGVRSVVDAGTARISRYSSRTKVQRLPIEAVSQASANQRSGRCGRLGPGICIRLYSEEDFETRDEFTEPEIRRTNLAAVILQMFSLGLGEAQNFPFVDPPDQSSIVDGLRLLEELDAIETGSPTSSGKSSRLTGVGKTLAKLPIDPRLGRMLIEAETNGSLREVLIIVAGLAVADPRERPADQKQAAREAHNVHADPDSDFITYLNLWRYLEAERKKTSGNQFRKKCRREFLNFLRIREWQATHKQLRRLAKDLTFSFSSTPAKPDAIHQAILTGLLSQVGSKEVEKNPKHAKAKGNGRPGRRKGPAVYHGTRNSTFAINPGSALSKAGGQWVMAAELVETSQVWARVVAGVDPEWICAAAEHLTKHSFGEPWWDAERGVAMTTERITLLGLTLVADRRTMLSTWSVAEARESFIHHALVLNDWNGSAFGFVEANQQTLVDVDEQQARYRTKDVEGRNDRIFAFFDERLPKGITNLGDFNGWWKQTQATKPRLLYFTADDIVDQATSADDDHFPAEWVIGNLRLELGYEYDPSSEVDGVSIHVPVETIGQLKPEPFEWTVPGFRPALIDALLRSLPKRFRKQLLPMNETVTWAQERLRPSEASLFDALAELISQRAGLEVKRTDFVISQVPQHLRPTFRVINDANQSILDGKDLEELQTRLESHARTALTKVGDDPSIASDIRRSGLTSWDFDRLEESVVVIADGHQVKTYPALFDDGDTAGIDLFATPEERFDAMWEGVRRLLRIQLGSPLRQLDSYITSEAKLWLSAPPVQSKIQWYNDAIDSVLDHNIAAFGPLPETKPVFESLVAQARETFDQQLRHAAAKLDDFVLGLVALDQKMDDHPPSPSKTDIAQHRDRLFYPGMMVGLGYARLDDASRYLTAMHTRIDSLKANPRRDVADMNLCLEVENEVYRLVHVQGKTVELEALVWQTEELRASLSAPSAFTSKQTVTAKKIRQQLKRISSEQRTS